MKKRYNALMVGHDSHVVLGKVDPEEKGCIILYVSIKRHAGILSYYIL